MQHLILGLVLLAGIAAIIGFVFYQAGKPGSRYRRFDAPTNSHGRGFPGGGGEGGDGHGGH